MDNLKSNYLKRTLSLVLAVIMMITLVPLGVFAEETGTPASPDATTSPTYYTKPNWEARIRDKSRWKVEDSQTLVRVTTSEPVQMNDIDYDGMYINANGRYVIRLIYKEKTQALSGIWYRALINFGDLDQYIDFGNSYVFGRDGKTRYTFDPVTGIKGRGFDLGKAVGDRTNNRKNLPINLVLKDGVTLETLGKQNYIIQMRITNVDYTRVYSYAPGKSSMDYSTYTKTTSVSLVDNLNNLFIKGGLQQDSNNATNQEFFMSEFIANPDQYKDESNIGIIRTQYMGQRAGSAASPTVGDQPIAFTQVFDANLVNYLKEDDAGNVAYTNLLTVNRLESPYAHKIGIKRNDINEISVEGGQKLAYIVLAPKGFTNKTDVKVVEIPQHDQYTMLSGFYITAIDYLVDKSQFENTFSKDHTRKLDYSTMSGWTNPNDKGWPVYTKSFESDYVVQEGDSFMVDAGSAAKGKQIMIQVGGEQAILRRPQGYYNGYNSGKAALDNFEEIADGVFQFTIGEGTTVKKGKPLKVYMPYTDLKVAPDKINFLQIHNGTKQNEGAATLTLQKDRNINMHLYKQGKKGYFVLKYTLKDGKESSLTFKPMFTWSYDDKDGVLTGASNKATLPSGGNFYINTKVLKEGKDIIVESYDNNDNKIESETSRFKYIPLDKSEETVKRLTWTDHSDKRSVLSINKSLYTPYQLLFTNDYEGGSAYKDPRVVPTNVADFNKDTTKIVGYTKYDGGKVRTLYEGDKTLFSKVEADGNEYNDKGELVGPDVRKPITIAKNDIFDAQFAEDSKTYNVYEYTFDLNKMLPYHSDNKTETPLTLLKDMKFVSTASDGSSLPSDLIETRVRARVLFDANGGTLAGDKEKEVRIVPDNVKFYGEEGYAPNGFEGDGVEANTGDKFPEAPTLDGKNFLGWVTEDGKTSLGNKKIATTAEFNKLTKEQVFTNTTPVTKHLVVYAVYTEDKVVTFDANGGKFANGKDEMTKLTSELTDVEVPKREGYKFKGWADSKEATEPTEGILDNVTEAKTVYAVWVQDADKKLNLNPPTDKVPVKDTTDLTEDEKDKVKDAVIAANPTLNLTKDNITVGKDGKVTVKDKDGKTGEIPADKTVTQKEVINNINPPEKPIEVKNPNALDENEKNAVKDAIIKANPDLNLKPEEITVGNDGSVTIDQGGKTGKVEAKDTVVKADNVIKLTPPTPVEVKDINNLTQAEKDAVAKAVKDANSTLPATAEINVDGNGNVTVTDGDKKGTLEGSKTVKPFDRTGKEIKAPEKTKVADPNKLTEAEKEAVREAVKTANPELAFTDDEIQVDDDGTVTVPMGGTNIGTISGAETVVAAKEEDKIIALKAPTVTSVEDPSHLSDEDKKAVIKAIKEANPSLNLTDNEITVADDGSVTVTKGGKTGMLAQADTVVKKLQAPKIASDEDGKVVVGPKDDRTSEIEVNYTDAAGQAAKVIAKKENGEWKIDPAVDGVIIDEESGLISIPADKIQNETDVKATAKDGDNTSDASTIKSEDKKAPANPEISEDADGKVTITPPTDKDATKLTVTYTPEGQKDPVTVTLTKDGDDWKLPAGAPEGIKVEGGKIIIPDDKIKNGTRVSAQAEDTNGNKSSEPGITTKKTADRTDPTIPAKTPVANPDELTKDEIAAIKKAVEEANTDKFPTGTDVSVGTDGKVTITYPDGSIDTIPAASLVEKVDKTALKTEVDKNNDDAIKKSDKYKNADQDKKDAYDSALDKAKTVLNDPNAKQKDVDEALEQLKDAEAALDGVKDTTPPAAPTVKANDDGSVSITPPTDADTEKVNVTYTPEGEGTTPVTVTATKGNDGKWSVPEGSDVTVDPNTGVITVPADKVKDGTEVSATATDKSNNTSAVTDDSKANAKTPSATPEEKPAKPTITANNDGSVKVTPPADAQSVEITYTPEGSNTPTTVTATKDGDQWKFDPADAPKGLTIDPRTGEITIPAKNVKGDTDVTAKAKNDKGTSDPATEKAKLDSDENLDLDELDFGNIDITPVANKYLLTDAEKDQVREKVRKAVKKAIQKAKPSSTVEPSIEVADNGEVTISLGNKTANIKPAKTVAQKSDSIAVKPADPAVPVKDPTHLTDAEKEAVKDAIRKANAPNLADAEISVDDNGDVTVKKEGKETKLPSNKVVTKKATPTPTPDYDDIYYPATDIYVGDSVIIYPFDEYRHDLRYPNNLDAPRGVYVRANRDGSVSVEISPDYRGPSEFYIHGFAELDGRVVPISIKIRAIDDAYARYRYESRRFRPDRRDRRVEEPEKKVEEVDTREVYTHKAYIYGYTDGTVRPNGFITRAEAAAMLSRLLEDENTASALKPAFTDTPSKWYNKAINAVVARGIMRGYSDGSFRPNAPITRAEFAQMISAIDAKPFGTAPFNDVIGHWAEAAIGKEYAAGRISGYPNGTFRPNAPITRAEAASILNKIFERNYDLVSALQSEDKGNIKFFTDLSTSFWGYNDMVEATNTHTFRRRVRGMVQEDWENINR